MKPSHYLIPIILTVLSASGCGVAAQKEATKEDPTPPVAQKVSTPPAAQSKDNPLTRKIKRRLKSVEPKGPTCLSGAHDKPFPDGLELVFENKDISVFAYPNTYSCNAPVGDRILCDVHSDSRYYVRQGKLGASMKLLGEGELKVVFGGPGAIKCHKIKKKRQPPPLKTTK